MANREFLDREFTVKFQPASALTTTLEAMMKFSDFALFTVKEMNNFQIKTYFSKTSHHRRTESAILSLEMEAELLFANFNTGGYSLRFSLDNLYERIKNHILENPDSSMSIKKFAGSLDLHCLIGTDNQLIDLGEAKFVRRPSIYPPNPWYVKVTMDRSWFREFIRDFNSKHDKKVSKVDLLITPSDLTWITPRGNFEYSVQVYAKEVVLGEDITSFQFGVWWDLEMFEKLCSASLALDCDDVELTVFDNIPNKRFYQFRFLQNAKSYYHIYEERVRPV